LQGPQPSTYSPHSNYPVSANHPVARGIGARDHLVTLGGGLSGKARRNKRSVKKRMERLHRAGLLDLRAEDLGGRSLEEVISDTLARDRTRWPTRTVALVDQHTVPNNLEISGRAPSPAIIRRIVREIKPGLREASPVQSVKEVYVQLPRPPEWSDHDDDSSVEVFIENSPPRYAPSSADVKGSKPSSAASQ
jgi:hypothetical protein